MSAISMLCADVETEIHDGLRRDEDEEKLPEIHPEAQQHEVATANTLATRPSTT